jgi:preprotein translocase subunit SecG
MQQLILIFHVLLCMGLIGLVLMQQGKGADLGASFGSGASQTVFGSQGSGSFLLKLTGFLALLFFVTSLTLTYLAAHGSKQSQINLPGSITQPAFPIQKQQKPVMPIPVPAPQSDTGT